MGGDVCRLRRQKSLNLKQKKQVDDSVKAAAAQQVATRVAELHTRIDEVFAKMQSNVDGLEEKVKQITIYIDKWLSNLPNPP
jgi:division protein CdvB (Snf7/Vps24/ESCRT-III family)